MDVGLSNAMPLVIGGATLLLIIICIVKSFRRNRATYSDSNGNDLDTTDEMRSVVVVPHNQQTIRHDFHIPLTMRNSVVINNTRKTVNFIHPGSVQPNSNGIDYFEVIILELPSTSSLFIGLAPVNFSHKKILGVEANTVALNATTGDLILDGTRIDWASLEPFKSGDLIGCAITSVPRPEIRFSRNGIWGSPIPCSLTATKPTLSASGPCTLQYNLGPEFIYPSSPDLDSPPPYVPSTP